MHQGFEDDIENIDPRRTLRRITIVPRVPSLPEQTNSRSCTKS